MRLIFYYQTTRVPLRALPDQSYVYVSALHFRDGSLYLNDALADSQTELWRHVESLDGVTTMVMLGGAGGAFGTLFADFDHYYAVLVDFLRARPYLKGIDLDVEEQCELSDVRRLIGCLDESFGADFAITMAPVQSSLETDCPGMGGFSYRDLVHSPEGQRIDWFNTQCYDDYTCDAYDRIIANGYSPEKVVFGVCGDAYPDDCEEQVHRVYSKYGASMGGVFLWEYGDTQIPPSRWSADMSRATSSLWNRLMAWWSRSNSDRTGSDFKRL